MRPCACSGLVRLFASRHLADGMYLQVQATLQRISTKNQVAVGLLLRAFSSGDAGTIRFSITWDFSQHPFFPVVGLKSIK